MRALTALRFAAGSLAASRKRTALCLLGISIGVAAVLVLTGLGDSTRAWLRGQFETIGTNVVGVLPGKVETTGAVPGFGGTPNDLTLADARSLARMVPAVERVAPIVLGNETVEHGQRSRQVLVFGSSAEILAIRDLELRAGEFLPDAPWERARPACVLGSGLARELFPVENPVGGIVRVGGWRMRVLGVLASRGQRFGIDLDDTVFMPVATAMAMFDRSSLFRIAVEVRPGRDLDLAGEACTAVLTARHGEEDFTVTTPDAVLESLESILDMLTLALVGIASISLAVAGIGIMNVMLVVVSERQAEVGLMKAVGAEPAQVLQLFIAEAALLSGLGGVLGLALGYGLLFAARWVWPVFPFQAPAWAAAAGLALSIVVGVAFGSWPASRAVRLDPVTALSGRAA